MLIFATIISNIYGKKLEEIEIKYHLETTNSTKKQLSMLISSVNDYSYSLISNPDVRELLKNGDINGKSKDIQTLIDDMVSINHSLNQVRIIGANGFYRSTNNNDHKEMFMPFLKSYQDGAERKGIWTDIYTEEENNYLSSTSYIRPVFDSDTKEIYGIVVIDVSYESIHKLFTDSSIRLKDHAIIVNSAGEILLQYPLSADYKDVLKKYPLPENSGQTEGKLYKQDVIIVSEKIDLADWWLIRYVYKDAATESFRELLKSFRLILAMITVISILYTIWITRSITRPIKELMGVCGKVMEGDFTANVLVTRTDELGRLGSTFNGMIHQINELFDKERRDQNRKSELEYQVLQAQINPHFLYNTLDSIKWLAVMQGIDNIADMSTALIQLLRYNLGKLDGETTLRSELESVSNYIIIQKYRYTDTFEFTTSIDDDAQDCRVLRFILQPLVENSIIHGFSEDSGNYRVHIMARIFDEKLHIRVIDNGLGIDLDSIEAINKGIEKSTRFSNIGVTNIQERLLLHFGNEAKLVFDSSPNVATIAEIIMPVIKDV